MEEISLLSQKGTVRIDSLLEEALEKEVFPGAALGVFFRGKPIVIRCRGYLSADKERSVSPQTVYDLASLTKVLATAPAVMQLVERGRINLNDSIREYFPAAGMEYGRIKIEHLLAHTSGLPAIVKLWKEISSEENFRREEALSFLLNLNPQRPPGVKVIYSDPNFLLLAYLIERVSGLSFAEYIRKNIISHLNLSRTDFNPLKPPLQMSREKIAPTEYCSWRERRPRGEVHDENCYFLGGASGQAGLFSCLEDLHTLAEALTPEKSKDGDILSPASLSLMTGDRTGDGLKARGLGWDISDGLNSSAGVYFGSSSIGHTGFTGPSLWHDPERELTVILLSNRVYYGRENKQIISLRPRLHNLIAAEVSRKNTFCFESGGSR